MAEFRRRRAKLRVKAEEIDYKNVELLKRFVSDKGKINPSEGYQTMDTIASIAYAGLQIGRASCRERV